METNQNEAVPQSDTSGASSEIGNNEKTLYQTDRYKHDMLRFKDENAELKKKIESYELGERQKKGDLEGVIGTLKDKLKSAEERLAKSELTYAETNLDAAIKQQAMASGIKADDVDAFLHMVNRHQDEKGAVSIDEKYVPSSDDIKGLVASNMERYSNLFARKVNVVDKTPNNKPMNMSPKTKSVENMSAAELSNYILANKDKLK